MAEITIRLVYNLETGKKDIFIDYESDGDALPVEHEREHRQIVAELLGKGVLEADEVGDVQVQRVAPKRTSQSEEDPRDHREAAPEQS